MKKIILTTMTVVTVLSIVAFVRPSEKIKVEQTNMNNFHLVDFVGWNTSFPVLAHYHTTDVKVFVAGYATNGMKEHETVLKGMIAKMPDAKIIQHFPNVARGEWTGVVGITGNFKMATVAKWRNGQIAEEYLFNVMIPANDAATMKPSAKPIISFENANDQELSDAVDLQAGWNCIMDELNGKRTAYFYKKVDGKEVERLVFQ